MQLQNKRYEKVLFVLTSHSELGTGEKTGFWTEEFAALQLPTKVIIDIATQGGQPPIDQK
jgi:hypothetical protein